MFLTTTTITIAVVVPCWAILCLHSAVKRRILQLDKYNILSVEEQVVYRIPARIYTIIVVRYQMAVAVRFLAVHVRRLIPVAAEGLPMSAVARHSVAAKLAGHLMVAVVYAKEAVSMVLV